MDDEAEVTYSSLRVVSRIHMVTVDTYYSNLYRIKTFASLEYLDATSDSVEVNTSTK